MIKEKEDAKIYIFMNKYNRWRGNWLAIRDTPNWKEKYPLGPVHFDVKCNIHNVEYLEMSPDNLPGGTEEFMSLLKCCF
jgi:hypothetical protein